MPSLTDESTGRKIVYVLGAGASRGAGAVATVQAGGTIPIPLQGDFWEVFLRFARGTRNKHLIEHFLFRYFYGYSRVPSRATAQSRRAMLAGIDVEEVFTFLSERARAPSTTPQLREYVRRVWSALVEEIGNVFARFDANAETRRTYRTLYDNQLRTRDAVVSFNYDAVFERSLPRRVAWSYEGLEEAPGSLRILKPHGSVGWQQTDDRLSNCGSLEQAVVVAPTHLKFVAAADGDQPELRGYLDQAPVLTRIWTEMERQMRSAKALVFIGYSFPVADLYFSSLLRSVLAERGQSPAVVVVNPDAVAISARLQNRFSIRNVTRLFDLRQLVGMSRKDMLRLAASDSEGD
jgi:hypothetical protein